MTNEKVLLTVGQAAERLGVGRSFLYGLVMAGDIASIKLGRARRVPVAALEQFVAERMRVEANGPEV